MKAAVVEAAGKLAICELPEPAMGAYQAKCRMLYGAVCAGTDTHLVHFHAPFSSWMKLPYILGHESVGQVVEVGAKVRNLKPGDVVTRVGCPAVGGVASGWGGFAEVGIATDWRALQEDGVDGWQGSTVNQILPSDIDPAVGTLFITWRETLSYLTRMGVKPGVSVLVIGSGGNGLAFVAHARNLGATKVTLVGAANRAAEGKLAGATACPDYRQRTCWEQAQAEVVDGYDFVIDAVGKAETVVKGQEGLKAGGTLGIYGLDECGKISLAPGKTFTFYGGGYDEAEAHEAVLKFYRAGKLNPSVWFDRRRSFDLSEIGHAIDAVGARALVKPLVRLNP
jgi:L-iditol 2-dehydrogenase